MFSVYILKSAQNGAYYIGSCKDALARLALHNGGQVRSTKRYIPWRLTYMEYFDTLVQARKRERQIKGWKKRKSIENLINRGSTTPEVGP